jgi:peptidoglycan-associated lipoprotein
LKVLKMKSLNIHVAFRLALAVVISVAVGAGCGPKRPPVVTGPGDAQSPSTTETSETTWKAPSGQTDMGPDVQSVPDGGIMAGREFGLSPESGPLADVHFDYDSAVLTAAAQEILAQHAAWLRNNAGTQVVLEGHTDERGTVEYNLALGEQRARAVYDYLTRAGLPGTRLSTISLGKERPLEPGHDESSWAKNRRVHFAVTR